LNKNSINSVILSKRLLHNPFPVKRSIKIIPNKKDDLALIRRIHFEKRLIKMDSSFAFLSLKYHLG